MNRKPKPRVYKSTEQTLQAKSMTRVNTVQQGQVGLAPFCLDGYIVRNTAPGWVRADRRSKCQSANPCRHYGPWTAVLEALPHCAVRGLCLDCAHRARIVPLRPGMCSDIRP